LILGTSFFIGNVREAAIAVGINRTACTVFEIYMLVCLSDSSVTPVSFQFIYS
jgi:hypothetical protein